MARKLPTLEKRALLHSPAVSRDKLLAYAESYLEDGYLYEAMEFFEKAREQAGLDRVRDAAISEGNAGLLGWMARNALSQITEEHWRRAAENAMKGGKYRFAAAAFERAGDATKAQEARQAALPAAGASPQSRKEEPAKE